MPYSTQLNSILCMYYLILQHSVYSNVADSYKWYVTHWMPQLQHRKLFWYCFIIFLFFFSFSFSFHRTFSDLTIYGVCVCATHFVYYNGLFFFFTTHTLSSEHWTSCFFSFRSAIDNSIFILGLSCIIQWKSVWPRTFGPYNKLPTPFGWFNLKSDSMEEVSFQYNNHGCQPAGLFRLLLLGITSNNRLCFKFPLF